MSVDRAPLPARKIVGQLAQPDRLRVVAALALGPDTVAGCRTGRPERRRGGLRRAAARPVRPRDGRPRRARAARGGLRAGGPRQAEDRKDEPESADPDVAKVLRTFVHNHRLRGIPARGRKRRIVLEYLAAAFEPGVRYPEAQVNAILRSWHSDVAALRRYLVDEELLSREGGVYWRTGGWVDVS